jgi:uncharacterized protein
MNEHLQIVGTSVRAAAFSALRAGLKPWCIDLFADLDLRAKCPAVAVGESRYPNGLALLARKAPPGPFMYTGGLENRPGLIRRIASERPLWGNDDVALEKVRDPFALQRALVEAGIPCLDVRRPDEQPPAGVWLAKPISGSGGSGIRFANERPAGPGEYLQKYREGMPHAAVFVAADDGTHLVGVTRQIVGERWLHPPTWRYCGSIGPLDVGEEERAAWLRLGRTVATFAGLRGVFGIDAIVDDGVPWLVEVNPRYTASVEVLEYADRRNGVTARIWEPWLRPTTVPVISPRQNSVVGKAVYHAWFPLVLPEGPWSDVLKMNLPPTELPPFADIPAVGQQISASSPVMTFFARAETPEDCAAELRAIAAELDRRLVNYI